MLFWLLGISDAYGEHEYSLAVLSNSKSIWVNFNFFSTLPRQQNKHE